MNIEKAKEIHSSQNWTEICDELDNWIKSEEAKLRSCTPDKLPELQLTIRLLEKFKLLPQHVIESQE